MAPQLPRDAARDLRAAMELAGAPDDELIHDDQGPAVYRLGPPAMTALACFDCRYTSLIPSIPRKPQLVWPCPQCGKRYELRPPAAVWVEGSRVLGLPS